MIKGILLRLETGDQGTFGKIITPELILFTGELPWRDNSPNISCIPEGRYICVWNYSPRFRRNLYLVQSVPQRFGIRKHPANLMGDISLGFKCQLNGCIALGERLGWIEGQKAVLLSTPAVRRFEATMEYKPFELEIRNKY